MYGNSNMFLIDGELVNSIINLLILIFRLLVGGILYFNVLM